MKFATLFAAGLLAASPALADHPYAKGEENSDGIAKRGVAEGTLHPGHVAVFASGKYNEPAADYHLDGEPYPDGPGGYATTKGKKSD